MPGHVFGVSQQGRLLLEQDFDGRPLDWTLTDERLIMTFEGTDGPVWDIDQSGPRALEVPMGGRPVIAGNQIYFHGVDGIYRLDPATLAAERLYALPRGSRNVGDILLLPEIREYKNWRL